MNRLTILALLIPSIGWSVTPVKDIRLQGTANGGGVTFTNLADVVLTNGTALSSVSAQAGATNATGGGSLSLGYDPSTRTVTGSVSAVGTITNAAGTGRLGLGVSGSSITGTVDVTGLATGAPLYSLAGAATGTPIYAETGVTSGVAQGQTANLSITGSARSLYFTLTGLATGTPVYSLSGVATGAPVYVELDATALAQLATASNSLRLGVGLVSSNLTTETANSGAASNSLRTSIGLADTNSLARDAGISNTIAALGGIYLTRGSNFADVGNSATARSNLGLGTAATNAHAIAVWNAESIQGVGASTQRVGLSLFSSGTGNSAAFRSVGGALAPPSMTATQIVFAIAQGVIGDSNLNASVSNAFQTSAAAGTNNARVLALETGRAYEVSYRVTSAQVANVAGDYVSRTGRTAQTVASDVTVYGGATVYSNLYVHTDALSSELLANGGFATDTAWVKGGSIYHDSGKYVVNDGLSGSLSPSGNVSVSAGGLYRVGYVLNGSATGTVTVTLGGATNAYAYALAGAAVTNVIKLSANNAAGPSLTFGTTAGQVNVDDFTAKGYTAGDIAAQRVYADNFIGGIGETSRLYDVVARGAGVTSLTIEVMSNAIIARASSISNDSTHASIFGGVGNDIGASSQMSVILGGASNRVGAGTEWATIAGGSRNVIAGNSTDSSIVGGTDGYIGTATGGAGIWGGNWCTIGAAADYAAVVGGDSNKVYGNAPFSIVAGGNYNRIMTTSTNLVSVLDDSYASAIFGGELNIVSGDYSVVVGGYSNEVSADYAWAAGYQSRAAHQGAWVLSDSQTGGFASTNADSFNLRFQGGLRFVDGTNVLSVNDGNATLNGVSMTQAGSVTALTEFATGTTTTRPARVSLYSGGTLATSTTSGAEISLYLSGGGGGATGSPLYEVTGAGAVSVTTSGQSVNVYAAHPVQTGQVNSIAGLLGAVTLTAGSGVNITTSGQAIAFASTGAFATDADGASLTNLNTVVATNFVGNGSGITGVDAVTVNGVTIEAAITNNLALIGASPISVNTVVGGDIATATVSIVGNPLMLASNNSASVGTTNDLWSLTLRSGLWLAGNTGAGLLSAGSVAFGTNNVISSTSGGNIVAGGSGGANTLSGNTKDSFAVGNTLTINARNANAVFGYGNAGLGSARDASFLGGGTQNKTSPGIGGVMPASIYSISSNAYALAGGSGAVAQHLGSFVWADRRNDGSSDATRFKSTATNQFLVRADLIGLGTNVAANGARLTVAGDVSVTTVGQRFWLSTNEYIVGTGTGKVFVVTLNPASTNSF